MTWLKSAFPYAIVYLAQVDTLSGLLDGTRAISARLLQSLPPLFVQ